MKSNYDISNLKANISINLDELDRDKNFIIHMTHRFFNNWKFKIEKDDLLGFEQDYITHSKDVSFLIIGYSIMLNFVRSITVRMKI